MYICRCTCTCIEQREREVKQRGRRGERQGIKDKRLKGLNEKEGREKVKGERG